MAQDFIRTGVSGIDRTQYDVGLRSHMQQVLNLMAIGLIVTGGVAWLAASFFYDAIYGSPLRYIIMFAPIAFMFALNIKAQTWSVATLRTVFFSFCATMGLSMGYMLLVFTHESVARAFFITAAMFGAVSLYGYTTKRDLTGFAGIFMMAIFGLLFAGLINIFLHSSMIQWVSSIISVLVFNGLTAYDMQRIKRNYASSYGTEANSKMAVFGALGLYLNFINVLQSILELTGTLRRN